MILGEAVDEGLIPANPCRKLRTTFEDPAERPHAIAGRVGNHHALMVITAAYTGLRWCELAGLQWIRTYLDDDPRIEIDKHVGALHEIADASNSGHPRPRPASDPYT